CSHYLLPERPAKRFSRTQDPIRTSATEPREAWLPCNFRCASRPWPKTGVAGLVSPAKFPVAGMSLPLSGPTAGRSDEVVTLPAGCEEFRLPSQHRLGLRP